MIEIIEISILILTIYCCSRAMLYITSWRLLPVTENLNNKNPLISVLPIRNPVIMRFYYLFFKSQRIHLIKHFLSEVSNYLEKSGKVLILLTPYEFAFLKGIPFKIIVPAPSPNMNVVLMKF